MSNPGVVVIDSSREKNEKLKKKWANVNKASSEVTKLASSGFFVSLLSPFDFDGPIVEIVTAVVAAVGFVLKKVSDFKLSKLDNETKKIIDEADKNTLNTIVNNVSTVVSNKKR